MELYNTHSCTTHNNYEGVRGCKDMCRVRGGIVMIGSDGDVGNCEDGKWAGR